MKFCKLAFISMAFISSGTFAATVTSETTNVVANVTVTAPVKLSASWEPSGDPLVAGNTSSGTQVGQVSLNGGNLAEGAVFYSGQAFWEDNDVSFYFRGPDGARIKTLASSSSGGRAIPLRTVSVLEGTMDGVPGVMLPAGDRTATFSLRGGQELVPGNYSMNITMVTYSD